MVRSVERLEAELQVGVFREAPLIRRELTYQCNDL
jgi:hypothetical protein